MAVWGVWISAWSVILNAGNVDMNFIYCESSYFTSKILVLIYINRLLRNDYWISRCTCGKSIHGNHSFWYILSCVLDARHFLVEIVEVRCHCWLHEWLCTWNIGLAHHLPILLWCSQYDKPCIQLCFTRRKSRQYLYGCDFDCHLHSHQTGQL